MSDYKAPQVIVPPSWPIAPGWKGGFAQSNPKFAYPGPDLSSLPILDNMDNIDKLQRCQILEWPEFSWLTQKDQPDPKRAFQRFAPEISRLGYTNEGRVYSIICPQQGVASPALGSVNIEVKVLGTRGWVDEIANDYYGEMAIVGKIWFSPSALDKPLVKALQAVFDKLGLPFPLSKANSINITAHKPGEPDNPYFSIRRGVSPLFKAPSFATHHDTAWAVGHLEVQMAETQSTGHKIVDDFNELVRWVVNRSSANMLQDGNILTWNLWSTHPVPVDQEEWRTHAERWRDSIDVDHAPPHGSEQKAKYFNGDPVKSTGPIKEELEKVEAFIAEHVREEGHKVVEFLKKIF